VRKYASQKATSATGAAAISRIEGTGDLRVSTLIEVAQILDLEPVLVQRAKDDSLTLCRDIC